ncbi:MAG: cyclic peptide export ABC transporter [Moorea sp. SIO2B7]|nr:cyclic peptide export ABC transporter [Moorena sp. SIO2B7]
MKLLYFLLRSSWKMVAIAMIAGFISGGCSSGLIALISRSIGKGLTISMPFLALLFAGLVLVALITSIISQLMLIRLSQSSVFKLQLHLSRQILASELIHLETLGTPRLLATLTKDIQAVSAAVRVLPFLCIDVAIVIGCMVYITWLSWKVLLFVILLFIIAMVSCISLLRRGRYFLSLAREEQDLLFEHFRTTTEGTKELKLHYLRRQDFLDNNLQTTAKLFRKYNIQGLTFFSFTTTLGKFIFFFAIGFVLFALPQLINPNSQTLAGYILTFIYITLPMENLVNKLPIITQASIALDKIEALGLSLASRTENLVAPSAPHNSWNSLALKGVTHTYYRELEDSHFTLGPIDLSISPGELIFIVGGNGSGKSTLAKLLTGLYIPEQGDILLDGQPIVQENREWYRQHFTAIFSDFYLFEQLLGLDSPDLNILAEDYLKQLQIDHKVSIKNGRFSTTYLSQGQRKRLALLTACLEDRPIYLFDEWAADQDPIFKNIFYKQILLNLKEQGKTILVISHDDHYFHLADRIIKLDYGQIDSDRT